MTPTAREDGLRPQRQEHALGWRVLTTATSAAFLVGVVLLPVMQFGTVHLLGTTVIPADACFVLAAAGTFAMEVGRRGAGLRSVFPLVVVGYLVALAIAVIASPDLRISLERTAIDGYCVVLGLMAFVLSREATMRLQIARAWVFGSALTVTAALLGVAWFFLGARDPAENFAIGDLGSIDTASIPRVVGLFENSNMFCNYLVIGLLFTLGVIGWRRPLGVALVGATGIALAFTLSPGLGGAVLAVSLWVFLSESAWSFRVRALVLAAGVTGALGFIVLAATVGPRSETWADAFETLRGHVVVGVGPGLPVAATSYEGRFFTDAHNAWLNVGGQAGLLGLAALGAVVVTICVLAWRARPIKAVAEPVRAAWCAFVGTVLVGSLSLSLEQTRHVWLLLGFLAAGLTADRRGKAFSGTQPTDLDDDARARVER